MAAHEIEAFEAEAFHRDAVRVRQWDDQGKMAGLKTLGLAHYRELMESLLA